MWEFRSLYIAISLSFSRGNRPIYSGWPTHLFRVVVINQSRHLRAPWSDSIFATLLRRRRPSHLVSVPVGYAQASNDDRNDGRNNDLDSESLHEDQARSAADHQMKK
jgi:hypothetical protein